MHVSTVLWQDLHSLVLPPGTGVQASRRSFAVVAWRLSIVFTRFRRNIDNLSVQRVCANSQDHIDSDTGTPSDEFTRSRPS